MKQDRREAERRGCHMQPQFISALAHVWPAASATARGVAGSGQESESISKRGLVWVPPG